MDEASWSWSITDKRLYYTIYYIATKDGVHIEDLVDDFVTFYIAGQETTANLLAFALTLTLQHPHVLERYLIMLVVS